MMTGRLSSRAAISFASVAAPPPTGDFGGEGMGRADQPIDFLAHHKSGKPGRAAEPADANLSGYRAGMAGAPGQRGGDTHALAEARQCAARQCRRFARAAENEEMARTH